MALRISDQQQDNEKDSSVGDKNVANLSCFKAYDIRGRVPDELNPELAEKIGRAYVQVVGAKRVVVGHDIRLSSPEIAEALIHGLRSAGADVFNIGLCGTEEVYFSTFYYEMDGGIMVTASHNPQDYNGMKLVRQNARPVGSDTGLEEIKALLESGAALPQVAQLGSLQLLETKIDYVKHLLGYIDVDSLKPLKVVVNAGHGGAGMIVDHLEPYLPFEFIKLYHEPDGHFPAGVPNPLLEENRAPTAQAVLRYKADLAIAWDGDFDRCFFFDEKAQFIEGYYVVGLLAQNFLKKNPGAKIIHDPRLVWNTQDIVASAGGTAIESKTGHAFIKQRMRDEDAVYGGEMSAHHYFKPFAYCDSGMIPWLLVTELMSQADKPLSSLVAERQAKFPASGEINRRLEHPAQVLQKIRELYEPDAKQISTVDGLSMEFDNWRFNLRSSNTEPVVRLNVESRGDQTLMKVKTNDLLLRIEEFDKASGE